MQPIQNKDQQDIRQEMASLHGTIPWDKPTINLVIRMLESKLDTFLAALRPNIDATTAPFLFTMDQQEKLINIWLKNRASRG